MAEAAIYRTASKFRAELLSGERRAAGEMVRRYGEMWRRLDKEIKALTAKYQAAQAAGTATSPAWLYQLNRLQSLQAQVEVELGKFAQFAGVRVSQEQRRVIEAAQQHVQQLALQQLGVDESTLAKLGLRWNQLPREAVGDLVGFLQTGSPLHELLDELGAEAAKTVGRELVSGIGLGLSPREVAARCRKAFGGNLSRALTVARTETMRAYREASSRDMQANSDLIDGWTWMCGNDSRTCAACWAMHGTVHPVGARLDDHPNGRCSQVPHVRPWTEILGPEGAGLPDVQQKLTPGTELFEKMSPERQLAILGPAKFAAYDAGELKLSDLVGQAQSAAWGSHRYERSLASVVGVEKARQYREQARTGTEG